MGLLENARYASIERGYDYYKNGNVISFNQISENEYEGKVSGSAKKPYDVHIDIIHLKKHSVIARLQTATKRSANTKLQYIFLYFPKKPKNIAKASKNVMNLSLMMIILMSMMKMMNSKEISESLSAIFLVIEFQK